MEKRTRSSVKWFLLGGALLVAVGAGWLAAKRSITLPAVQPESATTHGQETARRAVHLYFGDSQGRFLAAEQRVLRQSGDDTLFGRQLIEVLIQGPQEGGTPILPPDTRLRAFYLMPDGTAIVDFEAEAFALHPGGVGAELLSIYAVINTLVLNVERIRAVKIMIGGQEAATLAGHVDLRYPLTADMLWVR